jgi:anti-sigma B factor antagonist
MKQFSEAPSHRSAPGASSLAARRLRAETAGPSIPATAMTDNGSISSSAFCAAAGNGDEPFRIEVYPERDTVRVAPVGELDIAVADSLQRQLEELHESGWRRFVLDLRGLSFIDSSGLSVIIRWNGHARANGISFELIRGPRAVQRVFELVRITDRLSFRQP